MSLRPPGLLNPRSDHTQTVEGGTNVNIGNVRLRSELSNDESRLTYALVGDDAHADSDYPHVQQPLQPGETRSLVFLEGYQQAIEDGTDPAAALAANQGAISPDAGINAITTLAALSATGPVKIKPYVNDNLQSSIYDSGEGWQFAQVAELSELKEFAGLLGESLDGSVSLRWDIENLSPDPVECSMIVRLLGKEVDQ